MPLGLISPNTHTAHTVQHTHASCIQQQQQKHVVANVYLACNCKCVKCLFAVLFFFSVCLFVCAVLYTGLKIDCDECPLSHFTSEFFGLVVVAYLFILCCSLHAHVWVWTSTVERSIRGTRRGKKERERSLAHIRFELRKFGCWYVLRSTRPPPPHMYSLRTMPKSFYIQPTRHIRRTSPALKHYIYMCECVIVVNNTTLCILCLCVF